jgi:hypothetical protein
MATSTQPLPQPGWYADPGRAGALRWWDGAMWSEHTHPAPRGRSRVLSGLPWRAWAGWLVAVAITAFVCFGVAESSRTPDRARWFWAGCAIITALIVSCSAITLRRRRWRDVAVFAGLVAAIVALALFSVSAPSTSRSCSNGGQPKSAGTYDCDTSDGLGGPLLLIGFFIPSFALASVGTGLGRLFTPRRDSG